MWKPIAKDTAYFRGISEVGKIYVDKTELLHELVKPTSDKFYFLSRPRRFGKSLMFFRLLGADIAGEVQSALGKADVILQLPDAVYIMEFKFEKSVDEALRRIADRDYAGPFRAEGKKVVCIGVNYSSESRNIEWKMA